MPFTPQVTNNLPEAKITNTLINELAENDIYLKVRADTVDASIDQSVKTTSDTVFNKVTTPTADITVGNITTLNAGNIPTVNSTTINNSGAINPTTAPTEITTATIVGDDATQLIPRGIYYIKQIGTQFDTGGQDTITMRLEKYIDGAWETMQSSKSSLSSGAPTRSVIYSSPHISSGADLRIRISQSGYSPSSFAILRKT